MTRTIVLSSSLLISPVPSSHRAQPSVRTLATTNRLRAATVLGIMVVALATLASATCPFGSTSPSVNICAPLSGSTVSSPVQISASAYDTAFPVVAMKVYLDYNSTPVYSIFNTNQLSTSLTIAAGSHHITVNAWDSSGAVFKNGVNFTVGTTTSGVSVLPSNVAFGTQVIGTTSSPMNVTVSNGTSSGITFSAPTITGDFLISSNGCGSSLAAGSSCVIQVEFKPTATGTRTGTLTIADSPDSASPHNVGLSGSGASSTSCTPSTMNPSVTVCAPVNGSTVASPFQVTAVTTDSNTVTAMKVYIDNVGVYTVNASQINTTLTASAGGHTLVVNAWDSTGAVFKSSPVSFTVSGSSGAVSLTPSSLAFGDVSVGVTSPTQTVTMTNGTSSAVTINSIATSPSQYAQNSNCGSSLNAGSSCQIYVTFTPSATGTVSGTLSASSSDSASAHTVALSGTGVTVSSLAISPANPTISVGGTVQFAATATFSDGSTKNVSSSATWASSNTSVATVNSTGLATGVAAGQSTISAAYGGVTGSTGITVTTTTAVSVLTFHNNNLRTGANTKETTLTLSNVNVTNFGKKFAYSVDGRVYAQPLYMPSLTVNGAKHNVVFVATEHDSVYAFDADGSQSGYLWKHPMIPSGEGTIQQSALGGSVIPIGPEIGITGTPVIDPGSGTLYVVTGTVASGVYKWRLHALDVTTGAEKFGGPVLITATGFSAEWELQRAGLLLSNGMVYIAFASEGDQNTWHGWIFGHSASTLLKAFAYNVTPGGWGGGVWQSAGGLGADVNGYVYFETGNGTNTVATGGSNLSDSFVKLSPSGQLVDYFSPFNHANMDCCDLDLAAGGPVLLPDQSIGATHVMIGGGKTNSLYVVNRDNMGKFSSNSNNIIQTVNGAVGAIYSQPAYWNGRLYIIASGDQPKAFSFSNGVLSTSAVSKNGHTYGFPGANVSISANGTSNGIVWAQEYFNSSTAILHAYSASSLSTELWNSNMNATRDSLGNGIKFMPPTIANGKVYIGTRDKTLVVYGLLP